MYRIKVIDKNMPNTYRWYNDRQTAHIVASTIIRNRDAQAVEVINLKTNKIEAVYSNRKG